MADLLDAVEPEREHLEVECRECRQTLRASSAVVRETMATSERAVLSARRFYYCSDECAGQLSLESSVAASVVESDGGERDPDARDDFVTVHDRLRSEFNSALVLVYDDRTEHFAYYDKSTDALDAGVLAYIQEQGFEILDAGHEWCKVTDQEQAWLEFRRHAPADRGGEGGEQ
jgi:hypothetical protein